MARPQQPEPERSGHTEVDPDHAAEGAGQEPSTGQPRRSAPVPPANRPGHHDEVDQDKPEGPPPEPAGGRATKGRAAAKPAKAAAKNATKAAKATATKAAKATAKTASPAATPIEKRAAAPGKAAKAGKAAEAPAKKTTKAGKAPATKAGKVTARNAAEATAQPAAAETLAAAEGTGAATGGVGDEPARREVPAKQRFGFAFDIRLRPAATAFGVLPSTAYVEVDDADLEVRFGLWSLRTPLANVRATRRTGPYRWWKVAGPAHVSLADRGVTFATNTRAGLCIQFHEPVPAALPRGLLHHPAATVTVADPDALAEAIARRRPAPST